MFLKEKGLHLLEKAAAQTGCKADARPGGMARVAEARDDREQREEDHQRADAEDEGDVARLDTPADDVGHERRLDDLADDVEQHERDGDHDRLL